MANEIYDSTWWGNTIQTASSIGTSTEMIQGQFNLTKLGDEEVTNGNFETDSDWSKGIGWSIGGGKATVTNSAVSSIYQDILNASKSYKVTFEITEITSGSLRIGIGQNFSDYFTQVGTYTYYGQQLIDTLFRINPSSGTNASIDNVSVKESRAEEVEAVKCLADAIHRIGIQDIQN